MKLDTYIRRYKIRAGDLADKVGISDASLSRIRSGQQEASLRVALAIERETAGKVKPRDLSVSD